MAGVFRRSMLCGLVLFLLTGCGKPGHKLEMPPLHPVKGTVLVRGQPTAGVRVIFNPLTDIGKVKYSPTAITDATGAYQITSLAPGDGAPLGEYAITFEWPDHIETPDNPDPTPEVDKLRGVYAKAANTPFKFTVQAGENTAPQFELR